MPSPSPTAHGVTPFQTDEFQHCDIVSVTIFHPLSNPLKKQPKNQNKTNFTEKKKKEKQQKLLTLPVSTCPPKVSFVQKVQSTTEDHFFMKYHEESHFTSGGLYIQVSLWQKVASISQPLAFLWACLSFLEHEFHPAPD